jgi:choline dehydrogenase
MNGTEVYVLRGRTLSGSSSINGMVYIRGHRADYDEWADTGLSDWSWDAVLPYFLKSERNESFGDPALHGQAGPLNVTFIDRPNRLDEVFVEAAETLQYRRNEDFNGAEQDGFGVHQVTQINGRRCSAAVAYLKPRAGGPILKS